MKKYITLFIILLCKLYLFGQRSDEKLNLLFETSNTGELETVITQLETDKSSTIGNVWVEKEFNGQMSSWVMYHQIDLALIIPVKVGDTDYWGQESYTFEILSEDGQFIYKRLIDKEKDIFRVEYQEQALNKFLTNHEQIYDTKIKRDYKNIVLYENDDFGLQCGLAGVLPSKAEEMMKLVNKKRLLNLSNG